MIRNDWTWSGISGHDCDLNYSKPILKFTLKTVRDFSFPSLPHSAVEYGTQRRGPTYFSPPQAQTNCLWSAARSTPARISTCPLRYLESELAQEKGEKVKSNFVCMYQHRRGSSNNKSGSGRKIGPWILLSKLWRW
ncbi:hypothetical protein CEXT_444631 [Caerostris extrusa]|uniref:Uncharacterized protein n=1 Tax=Caerostris extrusa TaxID=172846 RepID=A0AAV4W6U3_CAEEX|nr:hypothetical protein CEXT_444631 [Caerostris extrusa]